MTNCVHTVKYFDERQKKVYNYMDSTFIFQRFQMNLFKQSKGIIAETGRFYMSNVHDESRIIRYKCPTRPTQQAYRRWCTTLLRNKNKTNRWTNEPVPRFNGHCIWINPFNKWASIREVAIHCLTRNIKHVLVNYDFSSIGVNQSKTALKKTQVLGIFQYDTKLLVRYLLSSVKLLNKYG